MSTNLQKLQERIAERDVPAVLVSELTNVQWLSGFSGSSGYVIVTPKDALFISDSRYTVQAKEEVKGMPSKTFASPVDASEFLAQNLQEMGINKVGFEAKNVTYDTYTTWSKKLEPLELVGVKDLIEPLRLVKSPEEIEAIRAACALADKCFDHVLRLLRPGTVEYDIQLEIEFFFRRNGAGLAFEPIVVSGARSARPHGHASEKKLERGDFVTLDFGAKLNDYNSDITRTVVIEEATERHREIYNRVLQAQLASIDMMKPGVRARDVDAHAREVLGDLAQYFGHGLGHGLGRSVHDLAGMGSRSETVLEAGQVWTVEPGVYIEGFGGVRIEDDVVVTENGVDILTHSPKELMILP
jgi:Xaa-Pro aminopeptidase